MILIDVLYLGFIHKALPTSITSKRVSSVAMNKLLKDKSDIIDWLKKYRIENYTLIADTCYGFVVNVEGDVDISRMDLEHIPVQFGTVSGNFYCHYNKLTSLEVVLHQQVEILIVVVITGLYGCPKSIGGHFNCNKNQLTSLKNCPTSVGGYFYCIENKIINLEFLPISAGENFYCYNNPALREYQDITDLKKIREKATSDREKALL